jgi:BirA family biotin operon repressor/biotin-[acetyl-CoA-carboxylase] ligase
MPFDRERYEAALTTGRIGRRVEYREQTGSTMDDARDLRALGAGEPGFACVAAEQLAGRGRLGREWVSSPGVGLYVTYFVRPREVDHATLISLAAALAVAEATRETSGLEVGFKWPNDVIAGGTHKLCGILAESRLRDTGLDVFVGIGVNVRRNPNLPPEVASLATSIEEETGAAPAMEDLLAALSNALEPRVEQVDDAPQQVLADWRAKLLTLGQRVTVATQSGEFVGAAVDRGGRGELIVRLDDGSTREVAAGDVRATGNAG